MEIDGKAGLGVALEGTEALCVEIGVSVTVAEILVIFAFVPVMDSIVNVLTVVVRCPDGFSTYVTPK